MLPVSRGSSVLVSRSLWLRNEPNAPHVAGRRGDRDPHQGRLHLQTGTCSLQFGGSSSIRTPITIGSAPGPLEARQISTARCSGISSQLQNAHASSRLPHPARHQRQGRSTQLGNIDATERHPGEKAWCHLGRDQMADLGENRPSGGESTVVLLKKAAQMPWPWSLRSNQAINGPVPRQVAPR